MSRSNPTLLQQIIEIRFDRGYRYLDRCGDALLSIEEALVADTQSLWCPVQVAPTGANLICPDHDATIVFDAYRLVVDQNPASNSGLDLMGVAETTFAIISARFDLRHLVRFGHRRLWVMPANSRADAERLSVKCAKVLHGDPKFDDGLEMHEIDIAIQFESPERDRGLRVAVKPYAKLGAVAVLPERLRLPPHQLPSGQYEALVEQLRRQSARGDPDAGAMLDLDWFRLRPPGDFTIRQFMEEATQRLEGAKLKLLNHMR